MSDLRSTLFDPLQQVTVASDALTPLIEQLLFKQSMFQFDAVVAAQRMIEADLYGISAHGAGRILDASAAIKVGDVDPRARVLTMHETSVLTVLDGSRALGHVAATKGIEAAIAKARSSGVGISAIGNSQTLGALSVYLRLAAAEGVIAIGMSSTGGATVSAPGTTTGSVGNAAFSYAIPRLEAPPIVFDTACGAASWAQLKLLKRFGVPIPDGLAFTANGQPTTDVDLANVISPAGGSLGFGLSLLCSVLAGPLSDGQMAIRKKRTDSADDSQHFFIALNISQFTDPERFYKRLETAIAEMKAQDNNFRLPGERGAACHAERSQSGIPLHKTIADEIRTLAESLKVEPRF